MRALSMVDIIVPVKNEAENAETLVRRVDRALTQANISYRLIVVDDRSIDGTADAFRRLATTYPIVVHLKQGKPGKAFSIIEGARLARTEYIAMIDGDLQYPPEALPEMLRVAPHHGVVVANRKVYQSHLFRKLASRLNAWLFGRLLFGFDCDIQSGLKVFRRELVQHIDPAYLSPWTLDLPLLHAARGLGFSIGSVDITFTKRKNGESKIGLGQTAWQIGYRALKLKLEHKEIFHFRSENSESMLGSGIAYKRKRFVTHSHLHERQSALVTFKRWQMLFLVGLFLAVGYGAVTWPKGTAISVVAVLSSIYFLDVLFSLYLIVKGLHFPPELKSSEKQLKQLDPSSLPVYSILCPLYKEAQMLPQFVAAIERLDWPASKLEVLLLLEEEDQETIAAAKSFKLPNYFQVVVVPHSVPKTKPKACNFGLAQTRGEYVVIYDAEDRPDPLQLKKAYLGFQTSAADVACLQAKLNYYNPHHNLLTKLFTAEYSLWFDVILPGLQAIKTSIPLGGTSNHFKTATLRQLGGWDAFNVTEDCDLGVRLFKADYKTAIIDSVTLEEANSHVGNWIRQRSRWLKGYLQTYLVHMRQPFKFFKDYGIHAALFQLIVGLKISFILINPLLWAATIAYFTVYHLVGPTIEALYPPAVFYVAAFSLLVGNFMYLYNYMIGCAKREHWGVIKYVFLVPLYWLLMGVGAIVAISQLIFKPHYWEKTHHGFHLVAVAAQRARELRRAEAVAAHEQRLQQIRRLATAGITTGGTLVAASVVANVFNFGYNAYLGRVLTLENFGLVSMFSSLIYLAQAVLGPLSATVTHRAAYLLGQYQGAAKNFWAFVRRRALAVSFLVTLAWIAVTPLLTRFFQVDSVVPFLLFTPVWLVGALAAVDTGFLSGNLRFAALGLVIVTAALTKLAFAFVLVTLGLSNLVYAAIPLSMLVALCIAWLVVRLTPGVRISDSAVERAFPRRFMATSLLIHLSTITFLSLDVVLAKHYLPAPAAGEYALLALAGKMIFFAGSLFGGFVNPLVSRAVGAGKNPERMFYRLLAFTAAVTTAGFVVVGLYGRVTVPLLLGSAASAIVDSLPVYALGIACFTVASSIVLYHQVQKHYLFAGLSFALALVQIGGMILFHQSVPMIAAVMAAVGSGSLLLMLLAHLSYQPLLTLARNTLDFLGLFSQVPSQRQPNAALRILVFNWRDTKHVWAGGAEVYIHQLAKRWVSAGHKVTLFCGNDGHSPRNQVIDGVQMIRRGGFFTVYIWGFLYYMLRLRGKFDLVVDSENGIPFFTPLYVRVPTFLLVYHVHQEIFRENLRPPLSWLAMMLEKKLAPWVYRQAQVLTISESSKKAIIRHGLTRTTPIVIHSGIDLSTYVPGKKASSPLVVYVGRLKAYKNLPVLIRAMKQLSQKLIPVRLVIAGDGEERAVLEKLVDQLGLGALITFAGKVSEERKIRLYQQAWVAVNPSSMEGWGITSIEANACGTPVVASDVPGLRDSVSNPHSGFLVNYQDPTAFANQIFRIIANRRLRQDLSKGAREWATRFAWDKSAAQAVEVFKS